MIVQISPTTIAQTASNLEITMPEFKLASVDGNARVLFLTSEGAGIKVQFVYIPPEVYSQWGEDDNYIVNYVLEQLNLIAAEE